MTNERKYLRFTISDRIEHWTQMAAFGTLGLTGLIQKFATWKVSQFIVSLLGGIETVRIIHRSATVVMMLGVIYHIGTAGYKIYVQKSRPTMLPALRDITNAWGIFLYNLGLREDKPQEGRFTFDEKFEYWAFVWGTIVMGVSGFMLWNPIVISRFFPGEFIPAAKAAHGGEAILAVLAIIVWHFYNVHIKHLNKAMFTGYIHEKDMIEEHPIELADIKAGLDKIDIPEEELAKRKRIYFSSYGILSAIMLTGVYLFVTMETTAIETIVPMPDDVEVFLPMEPTPFPTPIPTPTSSDEESSLDASWSAGIGDLFLDRCGQCHGDLALAGLDVTTLDTILAGSNSGPQIIPGDAESSPLVILQAGGGHPGQLSGEELSVIREWIDLGTPE